MRMALVITCVVTLVSVGTVTATSQTAPVRDLWTFNGSVDALTLQGNTLYAAATHAGEPAYRRTGGRFASKRIHPEPAPDRAGRNHLCHCPRWSWWMVRGRNVRHDRQDPLSQASRGSGSTSAWTGTWCPAVPDKGVLAVAVEGGRVFVGGGSHAWGRTPHFAPGRSRTEERPSAPRVGDIRRQDVSDLAVWARTLYVLGFFDRIGNKPRRILLLSTRTWAR